MTDLRDINSTSNTTKNLHGLTIHTVRDSLISEILLSVIIGLTIITGMTLVKCYIQIITVEIYPQFTLLIVAVIHTFIRRARKYGFFKMLISHLLVSVLFYLVAVQIPQLQFGLRTANRICLILLLFGFTVFSVLYRLKPAFMAADTQFIVLPAGIHVFGYFFCLITHREDLAADIMFNTVAMTAIYIIMRQIAVFDTKYYHSIHKISRSSSLLKKQNYKTVAFLAGVIAVTLGVLAISPYAWLSNLYALIVDAILRLIAYLFRNFDPHIDEEFVPLRRDRGDDWDYGGGGWLGILILQILAVIIVILIAILVFNSVRQFIKSAPKNPENMKEEDALIDTIEDIPPEKRSQVAKNRDFGTGYERRIRKRFYDKTRRAIKKGLPVSDSSSPGQIEDVLLAGGDKEIASLKKEYEKVRYGVHSEPGQPAT